MGCWVRGMVLFWWVRVYGKGLWGGWVHSGIWAGDLVIDVPSIYMQEFRAIISINKSSIRFTINKKKVSLDVEIFREILQIYPKIPRQEFKDLPLEYDIISLIRDIGHTRDITYLIDIENKDAKKTNKISYPRFTKIVIDYFMSKDQSISRGNKMFWHTARDDTIYTSMRCISRNEKTQVYGTILPKELTDQAMLESKAYQRYYALVSEEKTPKLNDEKKQPAKKPKSKGLAVLSEVALTEAEQLKLVTKKSKKDFHISLASGLDERTGTIPRVPDVPICDSESDKKSWVDSDEEDDDMDDVEDDVDNNDDDSDDNDESDEQRTESDIDEIPDPNMTNVDQNEHEEEDVDERVHTPLDYELTGEEKIYDEENIDEEEEDEVTKELYDDVNVDLGNEDTKMIIADQGASEQLNASHLLGFEKEEEDAHATLTPVLDTQKTKGPIQSSYVSFDFTSKLLNLDNPSLSDNEIASLMDISAYHATVILEITSSFTTPTPPLPPFFNPLSQQATPTLTPTALESTTLLPALPDFAFVFKFNERVTNLEKDLSEIKQVDQYTQGLSSILAIVDHYIDNKLREAINKAIQAYNFVYREEAQAKKREYIELVDSTIRTIIKEEVNAQLPQILHQAISDVAYFGFSDRRLDQTTTFSIPSNSE
nr:hypothetical protein [Tanacetum cinerariifolium]